MIFNRLTQIESIKPYKQKQLQNYKMSSNWVFTSTSNDENIELIYCSAVLESCPPQYVFTIKMKSGQLLKLDNHSKFFNLFTERDLVAINSAQENLNALYEKAATLTHSKYNRNKNYCSVQ